MRIELADELGSSSDYQQDIFRLAADQTDEWVLTFALKLPRRRHGDNKPISKKQRETLAAFFWGTDLLPEAFGWQQASRLMDMRGLAYAVAETMQDGFLAANRMEIAPIIAAHISRSDYLSAVARSWNLGTWRDHSDRNPSDWLMLVASPFYRELLEFGLAAREDLDRLLNGDGLSASQNLLAV